jgi:hypothetical protein
MKDHFNWSGRVCFAEDCEPLHTGIVAGEYTPAEGADLPGKKFRSITDPECSLDNFGQHRGYGAQPQAGTPFMQGWIPRETRRVPELFSKNIPASCRKPDLPPDNQQK